MLANQRLEHVNRGSHDEMCAVSRALEFTAIGTDSFFRSLLNTSSLLSREISHFNEHDRSAGAL